MASPYGPRKFTSIDDYHAAQSDEVRSRLDQMRAIIQKAAPGASEIISYNMPAFRGYKNLVYYAANKAHLGFYPTALPTELFAKELESYKTSKGAIQFPYDRPLPAGLISKIVRYRVQEDKALQKQAAAKKSRH